MQDQVEAVGYRPPAESFWIMADAHLRVCVDGLPSMAVRFHGRLARPFETDGDMLIAFGQPVILGDIAEPLLVARVS